MAGMARYGHRVWSEREREEFCLDLRVLGERTFVKQLSETIQQHCSDNS